MEDRFVRPQDEAPSESFVWQVNHVGLSVELSVAVLRAIRSQLARGEEVGGILLGSQESDEVVERTRVDAFEPFTIEHRYGLGFSLSLRDQKRLRQRVERLERGRQRPVGIFRTHLRRGLYLDQRDFDLFSNEFRSPASVFLVVRAEEDGEARGGVFVWEGNDLRRHASYLEFLIGEQDVRAVGAAPAPAVTVRERAAPPKPVPAVVVPPRVPVAQSEPRRFAPAPTAPPVKQEPSSYKSPAYALMIPALPQVQPALRALGIQLRAAAQAVDMAHVRAAGIGAASVAVLLTTFYVGRSVGLREQHDFPRAVSAKMERHRTPSRREPAAEPIPQREAPAVPAQQFETAANPVTPLRPDEGGADTVEPPANYRERSVLPARSSGRKARIWRGTPASPAQSVSSAPMLPDPPAVAAGPMPQIPKLVLPASIPRSGPPQRVVAYIKPSQSLLRRLPVLRAFSKSNENFVPANPLEHPLPASAPAADADRDGSVELAAKIDRSGKVVNVKMVQGSNDLARASASVLYRWRFEPARQNGEPVDSEMLVRFEFSEMPR